MKIVADAHIPFLKGVLEPFAEVLYLPGSSIAPHHLKGADALLVRTRTQCNAQLLRESGVKFIATATIGTDHIDLDWCREQGIYVTNAPGCNSGSVMQYVASVLAVMASRRALRFSDITLGVVGVGHVGSKVARLGQLLGCKVLLNDPPRALSWPVDTDTGLPFVSLETLLSNSTVVSLHVPLELSGNFATFHLIDRQTLGCMRPEAILINAARGEVVSTEALKQHKLQNPGFGIVLDTWENEPNADSILLQTADLATPHIAGYSADGKATATRMVIEALSRFFSLPDGLHESGPLPEPAVTTVIPSPPSGLSQQEQICHALLHTYNITSDHQRFLANPQQFEQLRSHYPVRREYNAFRLPEEYSTGEVGNVLRAMGFNG